MEHIVSFHDLVSRNGVYESLNELPSSAFRISRVGSDRHYQHWGWSRLLTRKQYELLRFSSNAGKNPGVPPSFDEMKGRLWTCARSPYRTVSSSPRWKSAAYHSAACPSRASRDRGDQASGGFQPAAAVNIRRG